MFLTGSPTAFRSSGKSAAMTALMAQQSNRPVLADGNVQNNLAGSGAAEALDRRAKAGVN